MLCYVIRRDPDGFLTSEVADDCAFYGVLHTPDGIKEWMLDEIQEFDKFLTEFKIDWCQGIVLKGRGTLSEGWDKWRVVRKLDKAEAFLLIREPKTTSPLFDWENFIANDLKEGKLYMAGRGVEEAVKLLHTTKDVSPQIVHPVVERAVKKAEPAPRKVNVFQVSTSFKEMWGRRK